jgi:hypothetical protein
MELIHWVAIVTVLLLGILTFFAIRTLIAMRESFQRLDHTLMEIDRKMHYMDPVLRSLSNLGDVAEQKTHHLRQEFLESSASDDDHVSEQIAEWLLLSIALSKKMFKGRK